MVVYRQGIKKGILRHPSLYTKYIYFFLYIVIDASESDTIFPQMVGHDTSIV